MHTSFQIACARLFHDPNAPESTKQGCINKIMMDSKMCCPDIATLSRVNVANYFSCSITVICLVIKRCVVGSYAIDFPCYTVCTPIYQFSCARVPEVM